MRPYAGQGEATRVLSRAVLGALLLSALSAGCAVARGPAPSPGSRWRESPAARYTVHYVAGHRREARGLSQMADRGAREAERFFSEPFSRPFDLRVFPDRPSLTAFWRRAWNAPEFEPQCWMVASGTAGTLAVLSPGAWKAEACEHDPRDRAATQKLLTHEIVHVYHGQRSPDPEFQDSEEVGWFVEGLAVLVSGQLAGC